MTRLLPFLVLLWVPAPVGAQGTDAVRVTFLAVGQGDAIVIRSPEGRVALIDAGPRPILEQLWWLAVDTIDVAVATHPHDDHIGGMAPVLRKHPVLYYIDNGVEGRSSRYDELEAAVQAGNMERLAARDTALALGSVTLEILSPYREGPTPNDRSVGVLLHFGAFRALLTGDSEIAQIQQLLSRGMPRVTVLKAAHHGATDGVTVEWLDATRPEVVVISAGARDYPHQTALRRYIGSGAAVYRTDWDGSVTVLGYRDGTFSVTTTESGRRR